MTGALRSLLAEPRPDQPPARVWRDWLLLAAVGISLAVELAVRDDPSLGPLPVVAVLLLACALLWRRTAPLPVVAGMFAVLSLSSIAELVGLAHTPPYSLAWVLVLPYALLRWASGRDAAIGLGFVLLAGVLALIADPGPALDAVVGIAFLLLPAALGASVRFRTNARRQVLEQVKLRERQQLARELHDTVAHHVSAIAVQAQAGRAVAVSDPTRAVEALEVIEQAASRTLEEMRAVVGLLRTGEDPDLVPQRGLEELKRLVEVAGPPDIALHLSGELEDLGPAVDATLYRLTQEAITNAVRHARLANRIDVRVTGEPDRVRLTVTDDGESRLGEPPPWGYGLTGMRERASLLGGTLDAGPTPDGGWTVHAELPRTGATP